MSSVTPFADVAVVVVAAAAAPPTVNPTFTLFHGSFRYAGIKNIFHVCAVLIKLVYLKPMVGSLF